MSDSLRPRGAWPTRLLCPWDPPSKNTGVGCHTLPQGDLPDPGIEPTAPVSPVLAGIFFTTEPPGKPRLCCYFGVNGSLVCITCMVWLSLPEAACRDLQGKRSRSPPSEGDGGKTLDWPGVILQIIPLQTDCTRLWQGISVGLFAVVGVQLKPEGRVVSGGRGENRVGQAFSEGSVCFFAVILGRGRFWLREREGGPQTKRGRENSFPQPNSVKCGTSLGILCRRAGLFLPGIGGRQLFKGPQGRSEPEGSRDHIPQDWEALYQEQSISLCPSPQCCLFHFDLVFAVPWEIKGRFGLDLQRVHGSLSLRSELGVQWWAQCSVIFKNHWQHQLVRQQRGIKGIHCTHTRKHLARSQKYLGVILQESKIMLVGSGSFIMHIYYRMWWSKVTAADWWEVYLGPNAWAASHERQGTRPSRSYFVPSALAFLWDASIPASAATTQLGFPKERCSLVNTLGWARI